MIWVIVGPVTPVFKKVVVVHPSLKNKSFETNYLRIYLTNFHQIFSMIGI